MTLMGFIKNRKKFLTVQCGMNVVFALGNYILGGVSGSIANTVTLIRNVFCLKYKMGRWSKLFFIALQVGVDRCYRKRQFRYVASGDRRVHFYMVYGQREYGFAESNSHCIAAYVGCV